MTQTLMQASNQWMSRPHDERFLSLLDMQTFKHDIMDRSRTKVISSRALSVAPLEPESESTALVVVGPSGDPAATTHWSFGQLCTLASPGNSPAGADAVAAAALRPSQRFSSFCQAVASGSGMTQSPNWLSTA